MSVYGNLADRAATMAAYAKDGTLKVGRERYALMFDHATWVYVVTDSAGEEVVRFNTKSLKTARQWLREYVEE